MGEAFPYIRVEGPPHDRGRAYGAAAGEHIARGLALYRRAFANTGVSWDKAREIAGRLAPRMAAYDADMMAELDGIAQGAGCDPMEVVILNARTEILFWRAAREAKANLEMTEECTSVVALPAATDSDAVLHGQNWDWNPDCADTSVVLHVARDDGPDILTFVEAGQLARSGMNAAGIALTANGLHASTDAGRIGTPNPFVRRRLLSQDHLATAIGTVLAADFSFSHNLAISHAGGEAFQFEATPDEVFWLAPDDQGVLTHANHFKAPAALAKIVDEGLVRCPESLYRDARAERLARAAAGAITPDTLKAIFADRYGAPHAILRTPTARPGGNLSGTVASVIMNAGQGKMWIARSPHEGTIAYAEYAFDGG